MRHKLCRPAWRWLAAAPVASTARRTQARLSWRVPTPSACASHLGCERASAWPYGGRYPSASLHHNGTWYVGTYALWPAAPSGGSGLGPFIGFRTSSDDGATWTDDGRTAATNLFEEATCANRSVCGVNNGGGSGQGDGEAPRIRFGAPHFVDFGRNMAGSPDGRAYLIGHGCTLRAPKWACDWNVGDTAHLARVTPSPAGISDPAAWEFYSGGGDGGPGNVSWSPRLADAVPLFSWAPHGTGIVTSTWNAGLRLFLTWVSTPSAAAPEAAFDAYLLESPAITGPFTLVAYLPAFGAQAYFLNAVSKFWAPPEWGGDPAVGILAYSADYTFDTRISPPGGRYGLVTAEFRLEPYGG